MLLANNTLSMKRVSIQVSKDHRCNMDSCEV